MKKLFAVITAVALLLSTGVPAFAAANGVVVTSFAIGGVTVSGADLGSPDGTDTTAATPGSVAIPAASAGSVSVGTVDPDISTTEWVLVTDISTDHTGDTFAMTPVDASGGGYLIIKVTDTTASTDYWVIAVTVTPGNIETVEGEGDTKYINTEISSVVLPTSAVLDFTLDPQGLLGVEDGSTAALDSLDKGKIVSTHVARTINNSSYPITLSIALTATTDDGADGAGPTATFIGYGADDDATKTAVETGTTNNVLLYAVPASSNIPLTDSLYTASNKGYVFTDTASTLKFVLDAAPYEAKNVAGKYSYERVQNTTGFGTAIQLGGYVNSNADWSAFVPDDADASNVGISAVFSWAKATDAEVTLSATPTDDILGNITASTVKALTLAPATPPMGTYPTPGFITAQAAPGTDGTTAATRTVPKTSITDTQLTVAFHFGTETFTKILKSNGTDLASSDYVADETTGTITFSAARTTAYKSVTADTYVDIVTSGRSYRLTITA